jgi:cell division septal protein FtsQ
VSWLFGRRNRRRREALPPSGWLSRPPVIAVLSLAVVALAWPALRAAVSGQSYFAVREVVVRAPHGVSAEHVRRIAGVEPGKSIWTVDPAAVERRLRAEDWVRSAHVRRELPHRVVIQLRAERPVAIIAVDGREGGPKLYFLGAHGRIFAMVSDGDGRDFPYLTGLEAADVQGAALGARAIRRALGLLRLVARGGAGVRAVSEIHVDRTRGLTLLPVAPRVPVELGWGGYGAKLARLPAVLKVWAGREAEMTSVNVLFPDEVIVRTRPPKVIPKTAPKPAPRARRTRRV